ncbi:uncharacterized protein [Dermacentor albipictus]|uniref:uncharacterized protein n=1 Tax=Dermacentor albipictus TaxID=60249 RepID=UPI0038FC8ADE
MAHYLVRAAASSQSAASARHTRTRVFGANVAGSICPSCGRRGTCFNHPGGPSLASVVGSESLAARWRTSRDACACASASSKRIKSRPRGSFFAVGGKPSAHAYACLLCSKKKWSVPQRSGLTAAPARATYWNSRPFAVADKSGTESRGTTADDATRTALFPCLQRGPQESGTQGVPAWVGKALVKYWCNVRLRDPRYWLRATVVPGGRTPSGFAPFCAASS